MEFSRENIEKIEKDPLMKESDRGCVLICASDIENLLTEILEEYIDDISNISNSNKKLLFDYTGPLGTFSSKILISYSIGLLHADTYSDINNLRILRNRAAHSSSDFSLSEKEIVNILESMNFVHETNIQRYSLKPEESDSSVANELIAKGYGFIRYDKSRFILTIKKIELELIKIKSMSKFIANSIPKLKSDFEQSINKLIGQNNE